jgi:hypothetical protein
MPQALAVAGCRCMNLSGLQKPAKHLRLYGAFAVRWPGMYAVPSLDEQCVHGNNAPPIRSKV